MSKAFTKESDLEQEEPIKSLRASVPPGVTNYITESGAKKLHEELAALSQKKSELQPPGGNSASTSQGQAELPRIDNRIKQIKEILGATVVAKLPLKGREKVRFGAYVVVKRGNSEKTYQIVGVDEAAPEEGRISWLSPLAQQLLLKEAGNKVAFESPEGREMIEIVSVAYEEAE